MRQVGGEVGTGEIQLGRQASVFRIILHPQISGNRPGDRALLGLRQNQRCHDAQRPTAKLDETGTRLRPGRLPLPRALFLQAERCIERGPDRLRAVPMLGHQRQRLDRKHSLGARRPGGLQISLHRRKVHRPGPRRRAGLHRDHRAEVGGHLVMLARAVELKRSLARGLRPLPIRGEDSQQRNHQRGFRPRQFHLHPSQVLRRLPHHRPFGLQQPFPRPVRLQPHLRQRPGLLFHLHLGGKLGPPGGSFFSRPTHPIQGQGNQPRALLAEISGKFHMGLGLPLFRPKLRPSPRLSQSHQACGQIPGKKSLLPAPIPLRLGRQLQPLSHASFPCGAQLGGVEMQLRSLFQLALKIHRGRLHRQPPLHPTPRRRQGPALHRASQPHGIPRDPCLAAGGKFSALHLQFGRINQNWSHRRQFQPPRRPLERGRFCRLRLGLS